MAYINTGPPMANAQPIHGLRSTSVRSSSTRLSFPSFIHRLTAKVTGIAGSISTNNMNGFRA